MLEIVGVKRLNAKLGRVDDVVRSAVAHELRAVAIDVASGARALAPVDTGRLRDSIAYDVREQELTALIGTNIEYAPFVEFGTRFNPAQPFLFPAFEDVRHRIARDWVRALDRAYVRLAE